MKILEAQAAVMSNFEVYQFLNKQAKEYQDQKRRGPPNLETLRRELLQYLETAPGPLSQKPCTYDEASISRLLERLRKYDITKGEMIMILNLRPGAMVELNTVIESMADRFDDDEAEDILAGIIEILGHFDQAAPAGDIDAMETTEGQ